jgi:hypothetical protein
MDEETARNLERIEALLAAAKGAVDKDPARAQRLLNEAHAVARETVEVGDQVTLPATLEGLRRHQSHPRGYWTS